MLPCASSIEKEGSLANSGRLMQWRYKAVNPPGCPYPTATSWASSSSRSKHFTKSRAALIRRPSRSSPGLMARRHWTAIITTIPHSRQRDQRVLPRRQGGRESHQEGRKQGVQEGRSGPHIRLSGMTARLVWPLGLLRLLCRCGQYGRTARTRDPSGLGLFRSGHGPGLSTAGLLITAPPWILDGKPWNPKRAVI